MIRFLGKLGIFSLNDLIGTIGGFLICLLIAEFFLISFVDIEKMLKTMGLTLAGIVVCYFFYAKTK
jgi:hypothetical protein